MNCDKCGLRYSSYCVNCKNVKTGLGLTWEQYLELKKMINEDERKENKDNER